MAGLTRSDPSGGRAISHNAAFRKLPLLEGDWFHRVALSSSPGGSGADGRLRACRGRQLWAPSPRVSTDRSAALPAAPRPQPLRVLSAPGVAGASGCRRPGPVDPSLPRGRRAVGKAGGRREGWLGGRRASSGERPVTPCAGVKRGWRCHPWVTNSKATL